MPEKKKGYKDLEIERENEEAFKTRDLQTDEKLRQHKRELDALCGSMRPEWEKFQRFKDWLFMRHCNNHKLNNQQVEILVQEEGKKELFNAGVWGENGFIDNNGINTKIIWLSKKPVEKDCWVHECNVKWKCSFPACNELTNLLFSNSNSTWQLYLCQTHYNEFKNILKNKPIAKW
jgi:hypothetical protein